MNNSARGRRVESMEGSGDFSRWHSVADEIRRDQVSLLYEQLPTGLFATVVNALLAGFVLWGVIPSHKLSAWLATIGTITVGRWVLLKAYQLQAPHPRSANLWAKRFAIGAFLGGGSWGLLGSVLFPSNSVIHQAFVAFLIAGMSAGALSSMSSYLPAYRAFLLCAVLPYAVTLALSGNYVALSMSIMSALMVAMFWLLSARHHRWLLESMRLRYENVHLENDLRVTRKRKAIVDYELEEEISEHRRTEQALQITSAFYRTFLETTAIGYAVLDQNGTIVEANSAYACLLGERTAEDVRGHKALDWTAPHQKDDHQRELGNCLQNGAVSQLEIDCVRSDKSVVPLEISVTRVDGATEPLILAIARDITERRQADQKFRKAHAELEQMVQERTTELADANAVLVQEKEIFRVTLASIGDAVITTDASGQINYLNHIAEKITGWKHADIVGTNLDSIFGEDGSQVQAGHVISGCIAAGKSVGPGHHSRLLRRDGSQISVDISVAPILNSSEIIGAVLSFRDITAQQALTQRLSHQATHDRLTGLVNRYKFEQRLQQVLPCAHPQRPHALLYLDLDQFKVVNDTCGHSAGDALLRQLATILQSKLRSRDTLARLGGDEFGVLLEHCPMPEAARIAKGLRDQVEAFRFAWNGQSFSLGVSIGLVSISSRDNDIATLLAAADSACYAAKDQGRNRVHLYQPEATGDQHSRQDLWLPKLINAMTADRLRLFYQPIVPVSPHGNGDIYGEVLLRLVDDDGTLVPPGAFLPAAERHDQMEAIDRWVVARTLAVIGGNSRRCPRSVYGINLSGRSISAPQFIDFVMEQIHDTAADPDRICFEITESAAIADFTQVLKFIDQLHRLGCRFALDDFGTGLSSFSYLKTLPIDFLKIDGSFVREMAHNTIDKAMVEAIHRIGSVMGLKTVAQWVEDPALMKELANIGVDYAQGYGVGELKPLQA